MYEGLDAIAALFTAYWHAFEDLRFGLGELLDLGNGVTLTVIRHHARPIGSSAYVEAREAQVAEWANGMVTRVTLYIDIDEARAAGDFEDGVLPDRIGEAYRGPEGMARTLRQWMEPLQEGARVELERIVECDDPLVAVLRFHGKARHTGIEFDMT